MSHDFVTIVSGLPRSGTSLLMQMLHAGGLPVLVDGHRPKDESNPRGYFEYEPVKRLRTDRAWLPRARGKTVKVIHLLLRELPMDGSLAYRILFLQRPLDEVLASQAAMLGRAGRPAADPATLRRAFERQLAELEPWLASQPCAAVLPVAFHRTVADPAAVAAEIAAFLDLTLDLEGMISAVDPALHRQRQAATAPSG